MIKFFVLLMYFLFVILFIYNHIKLELRGSRLHYYMFGVLGVSLILYALSIPILDLVGRLDYLLYVMVAHFLIMVMLNIKGRK